MGRSGRVRFQLLGRFAAEIIGGSEQVDVSGRLRRALIGYLALQPDFSETRERLAALLWGDSPDAKARQSLRQLLLDLRREFEPVAPVLKIDRDLVALDSNLIEIDAREFLALCRSAGAADAERAAALYRGPLLDGVDGIEGFDGWLRTERARYEAAAAELFGRLARQADESRNGAQALAAVESLVALDPLREDAQRLRLRIVARYRGRDAALAQGDAMTRTLRAELDAEPEPETAAVIEEIRRSPAEPEPVTVRRRSVEIEAAVPALASPPAAGAFARRRTAFAVSAAAACAVVAVVAFARGWPIQANVDVGSSPQSPSQTTATVQDQSWASPRLLPGIAAGGPALAQQGITAVVVLPFASDGTERSPEQTGADNITGDLINDLSRVPGLRVISRATSRLYRGRAVDVAAVGAELGVRYVVEGDVRLNEGHLRVNIALTDTKSRLQVWSERFERDNIDRPGMQNEIVRGLARQLQVNVLAVEDLRRMPDKSRDPTTADLLAKGWGAILRGGREGMTTSGADSYFEQVLARDPNNVSALTGLGAHYAAGVGDALYTDPAPFMKKGEEVLGRAISLSPTYPTAHYFLGTLYKARGEPQAALAAFAKALELDPSFAPAYANSGHVLYKLGRLEQAADYVNYAIRLSPKDPNLGRWSYYAGTIEIAAGHDEAAQRWLRRAADSGMGSAMTHAALAAVYALRGDDTNAAMEAAEVRRVHPQLTLEAMIRLVRGGTESDQPTRRLIEGLRKAFGNAS